MNCHIFGALLVREGFSQQAQFGAHLISQVLKSQAGSFVRYCVFVVLYDLRGRRTALPMFSIVWCASKNRSAMEIPHNSMRPKHPAQPSRSFLRGVRTPHRWTSEIQLGDIFLVFDAQADCNRIRHVSFIIVLMQKRKTNAKIWVKKLVAFRVRVQTCAGFFLRRVYPPIFPDISRTILSCFEVVSVFCSGRRVIGQTVTDSIFSWRFVFLSPTTDWVNDFLQRMHFDLGHVTYFRLGMQDGSWTARCRFGYV